VPDPNLPLLGPHSTRGVYDDVHVGPNAVPALAGEGTRWRNISAPNTVHSLRRPGAGTLDRRHWRMGRSPGRRPAAIGSAVTRLTLVGGAEPSVQARLGPVPSNCHRDRLVCRARVITPPAKPIGGPGNTHVLSLP
jgi:hypothetical protein